MIDEPEQESDSSNPHPDKMTEEIAEIIRSTVDVIHELTAKMSPPMDPRSFGLLEMAADLLLEQIETGRLYYPDTNNEESSLIQDKLKEVQENLTLLQNSPKEKPKTLGDQMEEDIHKFFEQSDMLPDEEQ